LYLKNKNFDVNVNNLSTLKKCLSICKKNIILVIPQPGEIHINHTERDFDVVEAPLFRKVYSHRWANPFSPISLFANR
jgi:hypothetical protein